MSNYVDYRNIECAIENVWGVEDTTSIFGLQAYCLKVEEEEDEAPVNMKGTRHPSTRGDRREATKHHKRKDAYLASDRDCQKAEKWSSEKKKTVLPWGKDKWLHPSRVAHSGRFNGGDHRMEEKKALQNWRAEYEDGNVFVRNASTWRWWEDDSSFLYNLQIWDEEEALWQEAWSERAEEEYWERVENEEWEEMSTSKEVDEYFSDLARDYSTEDGLARDTPAPCGLERDDTLCTITCDGHSFVADEDGGAWLYRRLVSFYGEDKVSFKFI